MADMGLEHPARLEIQKITQALRIMFTWACVSTKQSRLLYKYWIIVRLISDLAWWTIKITKHGIKNVQIYLTYKAYKKNQSDYFDRIHLPNCPGLGFA